MLSYASVSSRVYKKDILLESEKWAFLAGQLHGRVTAAEMEETISGVMREISFVKNKCIPPEAYEPDATDKRTFCVLYHAYEDFRKAAGKIDFDDMLIVAREIFLIMEWCLKNTGKSIRTL